MLDQALVFIRDLLDAHLRRRLGLSDSVVILNHIGSNDADRLIKNQNRLVITLVQLEFETSKGFYNSLSHPSIRKQPPQRFNLKVLMSANFDDYIETLKILSETILFFQANPTFQASKYPQLPFGLTALQFEVENFSETKEFEIWNALGSRYLPSIVYKIRHVTLDANQIAEVSTSSDQIDVEMGS